MTEFKKKLLLIDGHALLYRAFHAIPNLSNSEGFPTGAIFGFFSMFLKALQDIKPTHALVTFDITGPTFRDQMVGDYKANRKPTPDELTMQLPKVKEILAALDIPVYEKPGYEADDLLGIISRKTPKDVLNIIVTGDMDLLQLINKNTEIYRFKIGFSEVIVYDEQQMEKEFGLTPDQWVDLKAIKGDSSDNISGVPGIGPKGALDLIHAFKTLDGVYAAAEKNDPKIKAGTLKKLLENKHKAYMSYKLSMIDCDGKFDEFDFEKTKMGDYDHAKVVEILQQLGIKSLIAKLPGITKAEEVVAVAPVSSGRPNSLIKNAEQALIAAYLLNPGQRSYEIPDWDYLAAQLSASAKATGGSAEASSTGGKEKQLLKIYEEIEIPLMGVLHSMQERGVKLDLDWLQDLSKKLGKRINQLIKEIHKLAGQEFNISSPKQLSEILFEKLKIPTENLKKNKKSGGISTAAAQLEKMRGLHPIIDLMFEYRELTKLKSTYVDALPELTGKDGRVHTTYSQTIAATGRLSSINPNLQNIPIRSDLGNEVRKAFIADKGNVLLSLDYSQIELRIAASLSNDPEMIKIFKSGGDFHTATAARIFGVEESKVTPSQRRDAKTINFSVLYGVSAFGLSSRSEMTRAEAGEYIKKYYQAFPKLKKYIDDTIELTREQGYIRNELGRIRYFPEINGSNFAARGGAERAAFNMPLQSLAADIIKIAMIEIENKYPKARMILSVHDELVFEVKKDEAEDYAAKIKPIMESAYKLKVPVLVEAKAGENWSEMSKIDIR